MKLLFLSFANQKGAMLPSLQKEADSIYETLSRRQLQQHYLLHRESHVTSDKIAHYLTVYRNHIHTFLFSGHAGRDQLLLEDGEARAEGIAELLGQCPQLKLVILNGCSTKWQVERLLEVGVPVVIATSAPVGDETACKFSEHFFLALNEQISIDEAFGAAIGRIQLHSSNIKAERGLVTTKGNKNEPLWGMYYKAENEDALNEKLPIHKIIKTPENYEVNQALTEHLWKSLLPYSCRIQQMQQMAKENEWDITDGDKQVQILNALPRPVGEHLRKLIAPVESEQEGYDKVGYRRLRQMGRCFSTTLEFICYVLLAQVWQVLEQDNMNLPQALLQDIQQYLHLNNNEKSTYDFSRLIIALDKNLQQHKIEYLVEELKDISAHFEANEAFKGAVLFMNILRKDLEEDNINNYEIETLCIQAEDSLIDLFKELGYLAKYTLAAVKNIDVLRYRHIKDTGFNHTIVKLMRVFGKLEEEYLVINRSLFNRSVLLIKDSEDDDNDKQELCLSPFIIDENAFDPKTDLSKLFFFSHCKKDGDVYCYKHINRPSDPILEVSVDKYGLIKDQFDCFKTLLCITYIK